MRPRLQQVHSWFRACIAVTACIITAQGTVKSYNKEKGFGFIECPTTFFTLQAPLGRIMSHTCLWTWYVHHILPRMSPNGVEPRRCVFAQAASRGFGSASPNGWAVLSSRKHRVNPWWRQQLKMCCTWGRGLRQLWSANETVMHVVRTRCFSRLLLSGSFIFAGIRKTYLGWSSRCRTCCRICVLWIFIDDRQFYTWNHECVFIIWMHLVKLWRLHTTTSPQKLEILCQQNLGWWNSIIWADVWYMLTWGVCVWFKVYFLYVWLIYDGIYLYDDNTNVYINIQCVFGWIWIALEHAKECTRQSSSKECQEDTASAIRPWQGHAKSENLISIDEA